MLPESIPFLGKCIVYIMRALDPIAAGLFSQFLGRMRQKDDKFTVLWGNLVRHCLKSSKRDRILLRGKALV